MCSHAVGLVQEATSDDREWEVTELSNATADLGTTQDIMNFLFATVTVVALFLCFFSLMASMVTNIREQTKEAGVLRALGLKYVDIFCVAVTALWWLTCCPSWSYLCSGARLVRVFVYEAYALVLASSLMGVIIGVLVGWTFSQQRSLFTQVGGCGRLRVCVALNLHGLVTTTTAPCFLLGTVAHRGCHHDRVSRVFRAGSSYPRPLLVEDANHRVAPHGGVAPAQSVFVNWDQSPYFQACTLSHPASCNRNAVASPL